MQKELEELNQLLSEISENKARAISISIKNKIGLLKACYDQSKPHHKEKIHELIEYTQLRCFLTGETYSNTRGSKEIKLIDVIYSVESIKAHLKKKQLPKESSWKALAIYSFYFGGYREFFRCFGKGFLKDEMQLEKEFLDDIFFVKEEGKYISEEKFEIAGAIIINEALVREIRDNKKTFTMPQFYGAMQSSHCQWYGIIQHFDIERKNYINLKNVVINSFITDKDFKVSALVHGTGGAGKSTTLRRLAIDLYENQLFHVIWVEDDGIIEFVEDGLNSINNEIKKDITKKFLIIIEDWYRMFENKTELAFYFLKKTKKIDNIRIVIGDRDIVGKPYKNYRNNKFELLLTSDENKRIIDKILTKYPDWKSASEKLFEKKDTYQSSLFLLLFILARIDQTDFNKDSLDLSETQMVFQNIIESDVKYIAKKYNGLAKALYYWGCVYSEHKIFISYETFLHIADFYQGNNEISDLFNRWNIQDDVLDRLKIYINKNHQIDQFKAKNLLQFNHDNLADSGLCEINVTDWDTFGDKIKIELLKIIIDKGDNYSVSNFMATIFLKEKQIFINEEEKKSFLNKIVEEDGQKLFYLLELMNDENSSFKWKREF